MVLTTVGGWGVVTADAITRDRDLVLMDIPSDLEAAIDELLPPRWSRNNPIDCAGGETRDTVPEVMALCRRSPRCRCGDLPRAGYPVEPGADDARGPLLPRPRSRAHRRLPRAPRRTDSPRRPTSLERGDRQADPDGHRTGRRRPDNAGPATVRRHRTAVLPERRAGRDARSGTWCATRCTGGRAVREPSGESPTVACRTRRRAATPRPRRRGGAGPFLIVIVRSRWSRPSHSSRCSPGPTAPSTRTRPHRPLRAPSVAPPPFADPLSTSVLSMRRFPAVLSRDVNLADFQQSLVPFLGTINDRSCVAVSVDGIAVGVQHPDLAGHPGEQPEADRRRRRTRGARCATLGCTTTVVGVDASGRTVSSTATCTWSVVAIPLLSSDWYPTSNLERYPVTSPTSLDALADAVAAAGVTTCRPAMSSVTVHGTTTSSSLPGWGDGVAGLEAGPYDALMVNDARVLGDDQRANDPNEGGCSRVPPAARRARRRRRRGGDLERHRSGGSQHDRDGRLGADDRRRRRDARQQRQQHRRTPRQGDRSRRRGRRDPRGRAAAS